MREPMCWPSVKLIKVEKGQMCHVVCVKPTKVEKREMVNVNEIKSNLMRETKYPFSITYNKLSMLIDLTCI